MIQSVEEELEMANSTIELLEVRLKARDEQLADMTKERDRWRDRMLVLEKRIKFAAQALEAERD